MMFNLPNQGAMFGIKMFSHVNKKYFRFSRKNYSWGLEDPLINVIHLRKYESLEDYKINILSKAQKRRDSLNKQIKQKTVRSTAHK